MARKEAVETFLSQFGEGDEWDTRFYIELTDHGLRIVWITTGPDDVDCGIAVISNEGDLMMKGVSHLAFDSEISSIKLDKPRDSNAWERHFSKGRLDGRVVRMLKRFIEG